MQFPFQVGTTSWKDVDKADFVVLSNLSCSPPALESIAINRGKFIRVSCLYGSKNNVIDKYTYIESKLSNPNYQQYEIINEFIKDSGEIAFNIKDICHWFSLAKQHNKYSILSEFKVWDDSRWFILKSILPIVKPDGVGIQLHLKYNFNAEIVLAKLPNLILGLQDYGVDVHFTECSVWQHKLWFGNTQLIWNKIFKIASELNVKSVTPWFEIDVDGKFMPSFGGWENVRLGNKFGSD